MADRKITSIGGHALAAVLLASCLPLEDLSHYSRGDGRDDDAGHRLTQGTPGLEPASAPGPLSRPGPRTDEPPRERTPSEQPGTGSLEPGSEPTRPESAVDAGPRPAPDDCPDARAGSCYSIAREPLSWSAALVACASWGGSLVSINSAEESDWLTRTADVTIWIGANDRQREGAFVWANGDPFVFELFAAGEPDNVLGLQDCVERRVDSSWNDRACSVENPFVCERPL